MTRMSAPGDYLTPERGTRQFRSKPPELQKLVNDAIYILYQLGVPVAGRTSRSLEGMAVCFLAIVDVRQPDAWAGAKDLRDGRSLKTRDIIEYVNAEFGETISSGSYDDIRREYLKFPVMAGVIVRSNPGAARNSPTRAYALNPAYSEAVRAFGTARWESVVTGLLAGRRSLVEQLDPTRSVTRVPIRIGEGLVAQFGPGAHNELIKAVIEEFLPRYGYGSEVLYVGDAEDKMLHVNRTGLARLGLLVVEHAELPDVIAYSAERDWLYLVEAVHTSGPMSPARRLSLSGLLGKCSSGVIYVTAFATRQKFRSWVKDIAWETEVWIAEAPDHVVHFDGERFLGPYPVENP